MAQGRPSLKEEAGSHEVRKREERLRCIKAISQAKQGEWMRWESETKQNGLERSLVNGRE